MKILSAEFVTSAAADGGVPRDGIAHVVLVGRSNVGKSTLINALCRRKIARTSAAPGKTRLANIYRVEFESAGKRSLYLVDLPGYGYARGGEKGASELAAVAQAYFSTRANGGRRTAALRQAQGRPEQGRGAVNGATLLLVDARHPGLDLDVHAHAWLTGVGADPRIVATKIDKLSRAERARNLTALGDVFGTAALPVSAASGEGLDDLWRLISKAANGR